MKIRKENLKLGKQRFLKGKKRINYWMRIVKEIFQNDLPARVKEFMNSFINIYILEQTRGDHSCTLEIILNTV
jgi:hypothetical protein